MYYFTFLKGKVVNINSFFRKTTCKYDPTLLNYNENTDYKDYNNNEEPFAFKTRVEETSIPVGLFLKKWLVFFSLLCR